MTLSSDADRLAAVEAELAATKEALEEALKAKLSKTKILDSGANTCIIADITHVDTNTVPLCRRAEDVAGVETASGVVMPITGRGIILGLEGPICLDATTTLLSVPQLCMEKGAIVIMDSVGAIAVQRDAFNTAHVNCIKQHSLTHTKPLLTATLNNQSLYEITPTSPHVHHVDKHNLLTKETASGTVTGAVTGDMDSWRPTPEQTERHQR